MLTGLLLVVIVLVVVYIYSAIGRFFFWLWTHDDYSRRGDPIFAMGAVVWPIALFVYLPIVGINWIMRTEAAVSTGVKNFFARGKM